MRTTIAELGLKVVKSAPGLCARWADGTSIGMSIEKLSTASISHSISIDSDLMTGSPVDAHTCVWKNWTRQFLLSGTWSQSMSSRQRLGETFQTAMPCRSDTKKL
jgi:hypothetical protein